MCPRRIIMGVPMFRKRAAQTPAKGILSHLSRLQDKGIPFDELPLYETNRSSLCSGLSDSFVMRRLETYALFA